MISASTDGSIPWTPAPTKSQAPAENVPSSGDVPSEQYTGTVNEGSRQLPVLQTKRHALAQLVICNGCCCGSGSPGREVIPIDDLKASWKRLKLKRNVQLTISGCVGPCDKANVVQINTAAGTKWLGQLRAEDYGDLLTWAEKVNAGGQLTELPPTLEDKRFDGYFVAPPPTEKR